MVNIKNTEITADAELTSAFEGVLSSMLELNNPKIAIAFEEFIIH